MPTDKPLFIQIDDSLDYSNQDSSFVDLTETLSDGTAHGKSSITISADSTPEKLPPSPAARKVNALDEIVIISSEGMVLLLRCAAICFLFL